jgi:hypothetical protein
MAAPEHKPCNPNWRGGRVRLQCEHCGQMVSRCPSLMKAFRYCGKECKAAAESLVRWKGGPKAAQARFRAKKLASRIIKKTKPINLKCTQLCLPLGPALRYCKKCGLPGVKKGSSYHPDCSPCSGKKRVIIQCVDCGTRRRVYPRADGYIQVRCRECYAKIMDGANNPNWKGGITPVNQKIRASDEYRAWRLAVFKRDKYTCVWCGQVGGKLHADHIKSFADFPELRLVLSNGRTLCIECHKKTDSYLSKGKKKRKPAQLSLSLGD